MYRTLRRFGSQILHRAVGTLPAASMGFMSHAMRLSGVLTDDDREDRWTPRLTVEGRGLSSVVGDDADCSDSAMHDIPTGADAPMAQAGARASSLRNQVRLLSDAGPHRRCDRHP